jgi:hypothetical protein
MLANAPGTPEATCLMPGVTSTFQNGDTEKRLLLRAQPFTGYNNYAGGGGTLSWP